MKKILTLSFLLVISLKVFTQQLESQKEINNEGIITFLKFNNKTKKNISDAQKLLKDSLKLSNDDQLILKDSLSDELGFIKKTFQQFYKNIKVEHGLYSVIAKNNKIEYMTGEFKKVKSVDVNSLLNESNALNKLLTLIKADRYKWENEAEEQMLKKIKNDPSSTYYPKGELVIIKDFLITNTEYRLAYKFKVYAEIPLSHKIYYLDARSGELLDTHELILKTNTNGTAQTRFSGNQNIVGDSFAGGFRLRQVRNGVDIQTFNMNLGTNYGTATDFVDNNNDWTAAEHDNANLDNAALDAHWGTERVFDYFLNTHNRNSYDRNGGILLSFVHANLVGFGFGSNINAFWDGQRMTYGDGGGFFEPLVSLDIIAHEIGHGVLESSGGLNYRGESGALNEGFSDIWAACVESQAAPNKQRWNIGEDVNVFGLPLRSMSNPNNSPDPQPDTYLGLNWINTNCGTPNLQNDFCGVHTNSGVLNYWFFLLTEGGSGTNDIGNNFSVTGLGIGESERIAYRTLNNFLASNFNATFANVRTYSIQAAIDLYGAGSCQEINVTNAWHAVGVGAAYLPTFVIPNQVQVCDVPVNYSISGLPSGAVVNWSISPSSGIANLTTIGNIATLTKTGNGNVVLSASVNIGCANVALTPKNVYVGIPQITNIVMSTINDSGYWCALSRGNYFDIEMEAGQSPVGLTFQVQLLDPVTYQVFANYTVSGGSGTFALSRPPNTTYLLQARVINHPCGTSPTWFGYEMEFVDCSNNYRVNNYNVYPNPASSDLTIEYAPVQESTTEKTTIYSKQKDIKLFNSKGEIMVSSLMKENEVKLTLDTKNIPNGTYFLHITEGKETVKKQIIIKH